MHICLTLILKYIKTYVYHDAPNVAKGNNCSSRIYTPEHRARRVNKDDKDWFSVLRVESVSGRSSDKMATMTVATASDWGHEIYYHSSS